MSTRVQIPAYTDHWMKGDRYGEIVRIIPWTTEKGVEIVTVKLDKSGKTVRVILDDCEVVS
jgi:hypothetical protein